MDNVGLLPLPNSHSSLLPCIDRYSCWPEAMPMKVTTASTVVKAFLRNTDNSLHHQPVLLCRFHGVYDLGSHGVIERVRRKLKAPLLYAWASVIT